MVAANNAFDRKLEAQRANLPDGMADAAIYVHDTLDLAVAVAQSYFGPRPPREAVLAVYDRIAAKHDQLRRSAGTAQD